MTTDYVLDELLTWMRCKKKMNMDKVYDFVTGIRVGKVQVYGITEDLFGDAMKLMRKYSDYFFSFTDCVSFEVMRKMKIKDAFTTDKHFAAAGFRKLL